MIEKKKITRSVSSMALCSAITAILSVVQLSIVARFLRPEDYGKFAISSIIIGVGGAFLTGVPLALIQRDEFTDVQAASMQKWLYLIAVVFMLILPIVGFFVGELSEFQEIFILTFVMATTLLITANGLLHQVWLRRELRMEKIAIAKVIATFVGMLTAIVLAWQGFGCWSLVWATVVQSLLVMIFNRLNSDLELAKQARFVDAKPLLGYGLSRGTDQLIGQYTSKLDQIVIGSTMGAPTLGVYTVASNIARRPCDLLSPVLNSVLFPVYARMKDPKGMYAMYDVSLRILAIILLAVASVVSLFASEIVQVLLGPKWTEVSPVLAIICFSFAFQMMETPSKQLANAGGFSNRLLYWNILCSGFLAGVLFYSASIYSDLSSIALVFVIGRLVLYICSFYVLPRQIVEDAWRSMSKVLIYSVLPSCLFVVAQNTLDLTFGWKLFCSGVYLTLMLLLNLKLIKKMCLNVHF